jgi:hypothetical protein
MKPFWFLGLDCYSWIEDNFLHQDVRMQLNDEAFADVAYIKI